MGVFKSEEQLLKEVAEARTQVKIGGFYAHYKHPGEKRYQVVDVAIFEDSEEIFVIYQNLQMGVKWLRTLTNFNSEVEVEDKSVKRFTLLEP